MCTGAEKQNRPLGRIRGVLDVDIRSWFNYPALRNYHGPSSIIDLLNFREAVGQAGPKTRVRVIVDEGDPRRINAALLIGSYLVLWAGYSVASVSSMFHGFTRSCPLYQTEGLDIFPDTITVTDVLRGLECFQSLGLLHLDSLDPALIEHYEDPENGDIDWIVDGMLLGFAGPDDASLPNFIRFAQENNVRAVVRLNEHEYDPAGLEVADIKHLDLPMVDGSTPSLDQIRKFYAFAEEIITGGGALAVHCRAGLGRTGTMIGSYLIRRWGLGAKEVIGYCRVRRPGFFLTRQPRFMEAIQWWLRDETPTRAQQSFIRAALGEELAAGLQEPF